ncbi:hypothetical protein ACTJI8_02005 [Microbacterium sp. 22303]|uniref:hypothetical protein n=1 Tax=Microbacterium sp. 22303 TaxID=3453905 RepID=UPI003F8767E4
MTPGAVRVESTGAAFSSYQGWVCTSTITEKGFWTVTGTTVVDVANWMMDHPTPGLLANRTSHLDPDRPADGVLIGNVPRRGALEGVVFTVQSMPDGGVAIRAEIGAEAKNATCPTPPGGGRWGEPGMG